MKCYPYHYIIYQNLQSYYKAQQPWSSKQSQKKTTEEITSSINNYMQQNGFKIIKAAKSFRNRDIAIQVTKKSKTEMLQSQCDWNPVLGENAKAIQPTFGVIVFNIWTNKINLKKIEKSIDMIKEYNKEMESLKVINILWLKWFKLPNPGQLYGYLISEFDSLN